MTQAVIHRGVRVKTPQQELPSLSLVLSLPTYNKETGRWHGRIRLHGRIAKVDITMFSSKFPIWGQISVSEGPATEQWRFKEKADGVDYHLINAHLPTMLIPHAAAPGGMLHGVGVHIALKKFLKDPKVRIPIEWISLQRSKVHGPGGVHFLKSVIDELSELSSAIRTSLPSPAF